MEQLPNIGTVTVTALSVNQSSAGACSWLVTFDTNAGSPLPLMEASIYNSSYSNVSSPYATSTTLGTETVTVSQVQAATSEVIGGRYSLLFRGARSRYISYNASSLDVQRALEEVATVGQVAVSRSSADENNGYTWMVTFLTDLGPLDLIQFDGTSLTGTVATGTVAVVLVGVYPPFNSSNPILGLPLGTAVVTNLSQLSVVMGGLDQGIPYFVRASAFNAIGQSLYAYSSNIFIIPEPQQPGPPVDPVLSPVDGHTLAVQFFPPNSDGGDPVDFYKVL